MAVIIRPDRSLPVQKLVSLMDALQRADITKVGIATQEEHEIAMTRDARFWRNVTIVGLIHVIGPAWLALVESSPRSPPKDIVWMEGGAGAESAAASEASAADSEAPGRSHSGGNRSNNPRLKLAPTAKSEIEIPSPTVP